MAGATDEVSCVIYVVDVNEAPIQGVSTILTVLPSAPAQSVTNFNGEAQLAAIKRKPNTVLTLSHPDYVREKVTFTDDIITGAYDNPLVERSPGVSSDNVTLTIRLGRWSSAPIRLLSNEELYSLARKSTDLHACVVEEINNGGQLSYRDTHMFHRTTRCAETTLTPASQPPEPGKKATVPISWGRFRTISLDVEPSRNGRLFWIESQSRVMAPAQTLSALVWSPNFTSRSPVTSIDIIFFYCPSTDTQVAAYPYGLVMFQADGQRKAQAIPDQSYMSVGSRYLQKEHGMIYTLVARQSKAIIIMPLNNKGAWDPFTAQEGVWRLCKEVATFLHREGRTSDLGASAFGSEKSRERCGGSLRDLRVASPTAKDFGRPPDIRKLAVAFFSAGAHGAKSCLDFWSLEKSLAKEDGAKSRFIGEIVGNRAAQKFPAKLWGCGTNLTLRSPEPKIAFGNAWTEIWDIDGFHEKRWKYYLDQLHRWMDERKQQRIIRLCHSEGRRPRRPLKPGGDPDDKKEDGLWKSLLGEKFEKVSRSSVDPARYRHVPIEEVYGERFSVVALDDTYISAGKKNPPDEFPVLLSGKDPVHQATFKIGWSHCVALSDVGKAP